MGLSPVRFPSRINMSYLFWPNGHVTLGTDSRCHTSVMQSHIGQLPLLLEIYRT